METPDDFVIKKPPKNDAADMISAIGLGTTVCQVINDKKRQTDCRNLLKPLESGKGDPIDALADLLLENPDEMDKAVERANYQMQEAMKRAEKRLAARG